jgi:hypothetical protein
MISIAMLPTIFLLSSKPNLYQGFKVPLGCVCFVRSKVHSPFNKDDSPIEKGQDQGFPPIRKLRVFFLEILAFVFGEG